MPVKSISKIIAFTLLILNCLPAYCQSSDKTASITDTKPSSLRVEGPRDTNLFAVEPTVVGEFKFLPAIDTRDTEDMQIRRMLKSRAGLD